MLKIIICWFLRVFVISLFVIATVVAILIYDYNTFVKSPVVTNTLSKSFSIYSGDTISELEKQLKQQDIYLGSNKLLFKPLSSYYFRYVLNSYPKRINLKIGEYTLKPNMTVIDLLDVLEEGKGITHKIRFQEGWTVNQMRQLIEKNALIKQTLTNVTNDNLMSSLGIKKTKHYEGQFFPDTYLFSKGTKDSDVLLQAYSAMQQKIKKAWGKRHKKNQLKSPYELLILASIIEKETGIHSERHEISGVFHRRLAKKMKLQTDPTVIYGIKNRYKGKLYKSDLKKDTPYNTYTRKGLPPTPIAIPSESSLIAAGQPDKGKSIFFVADGKGGHVFSETYKQHLKAVKNYRNKMKLK